MISSRAIALLAAALFWVSMAQAQVAGKVTGSVVDASGAAVPNAAVSLQLSGSGSNVYSTETTSGGDFTLPTVNPATYDLVVEAKGFTKAVVKGIDVDPGRSKDVPPIKLELAAVTQTVEVHESAQNVQTSNAEVTTTIVRSQVQNLPTLNRSPLGFLQTQAGINNNRGSTTVNGQRPTYVNVTLDGINIQDNFIRTNDVDFLPNLLLSDQVAEITVTTSNASAANFGGSAQVQFVTPSGSNDFHGGAFWSNRNNYFAANTWFNNQSGVGRPFLNQNQLGGSLGGRIIKNKLFFYTNFEAFRLRQQTTQNHTILTDSARNGVYTYRDSSGTVQKLNILQVAGIQADAAATALLGQVPGPSNINNYLVGDSTAALVRNTAGYLFLKRNNRTRDNVTIKGDYLPSTKHVFTVSYIYNRDILDRPDLDTTYSLVPSVTNNDPVKLLSSAWRWNPKPNLTNEVRFGFNWAPAIFAAVQEIPKFFVSGLTYTNPLNTFRSQGRNTDTYNFADNGNWIHGPHSLAFGFQGQTVRVEQFNDAGITASYGLGVGSNPGLTAAQLPGISATDLAAANTLLATFAGYVQSYTQTFNVTSRTSGFVNGATNLRHNTFDNYALYVQDSWKIKRRLTATLGLRWDYYTPVDERDALALLPVLQNNNVIQTVMSPNTVLDFAGSAVGRPWYKSDKNNFAPNAGLAWDVFGNGKTALRAGYSFSYVNDNMIRAADNSQSTNSGLQQAVSAAGLAGRLSTSPPAITVPAFKVPRTLADNYAVNSSAAVAIPAPDLAAPYVQQWNISAQQAIKGTIVEVRYVGNHATKAVRGFDYNQVLIDAMLPDFLKARNNGLLAQSATGSFRPEYNANIAGSQQLPFFAQLPNAGRLATDATVVNLIQTGQMGELGSYYQTGRFNGPLSFFANPNVLGANVLTNYSNASYNGLQVDVTRRFSRGLQFQFNYVYSRVLSDAAGNGQTNFEPFLDIRNAKIERSRVADFDLTHVFKANASYDLPFGKGKRFTSDNRVLARAMEGWNVAGIFTKQSGTPFGVYSGRGTVNRSGRSGNNTVNTLLDKGQLDQIFQFRMTGTGPFFVPDSVKGTDLRAVAPDGAAPFAGQVFFQPAAGTLGTLQRNYFSGPWVWDLDFKISKGTRITERQSIELRMETFNAFNHPTFSVGDQTVTSTTFGKITGTFYGRRVVQFALYYRF